LLSNGEERTFIVPGGSTPHLFYEYLADQVTDWKGVILIPSDERLVDETSSESNVGMIRENLLERIKVKDKPTLFSFLDGDRSPDSDQVLSSLSQRVESLIPTRAAFLGIGEDGHTASLFPGYENPHYSKETLLFIKRDTESFQRASINVNFLANTGTLVFLVTGKRKKPVMEKILSNDNSADDLPVMNVIKQSTGTVKVLCDRDASPYD
jgi:6-phosphogluconolactonase